MVKLNGLLKSEMPVLVIFFATWCPHCQRMQSIWDKLEKRGGKRVNIERYDIDAPENEKLIQYYKVQSVSTMMIFKEGDQVWRQSGELTFEQLEEVMNMYV